MGKKRIFITIVLLAAIMVGAFNTSFALADDESNTWKYDKWIWIGDSRTVGMQKVTDMEAIAINGAKYAFFDDNFDDINALRGYNIVFNLGVNDLGNSSDSPGTTAAWKYLTKFAELSPEFFTQNNVMFMAVNPTNSSRKLLNGAIEDFNNEMWRNLTDGWTFLDTYTWMSNNGFETVDGLHYTEETYQVIYNKVTSVEGCKELVRPFDEKSKMIQYLEEQFDIKMEDKNGSIAGVYLSDGVIIFVEEFDKDNSPFQSSYVLADVYLKDVSSLKTYYQEQDGIGLFDVAEIDRMSERVQALFSCNGDFYFVENKDKEVLRNGEIVLEQDTIGDRDYCILYSDGTMDTIKHQSAQEDPSILKKAKEKAWQIWSFGPVLLDAEGHHIEDFSDIYNPGIVGANPRTAIGYFAPNHFCFLFVSGRLNGNKGATMQELSEFFESLGCTKAYNLDGGGTSHIWFKGKTLGEPCEPRRFSDIIYIGYPTGEEEPYELQNVEEVIRSASAFCTHQQLMRKQALHN